MHWIALVIATVILQAPEEAFFDDLRTAVSSNNPAKVIPFFANRQYSEYFLAAAGRRQMRNFRVHMIPAPPGRTKEGAYWAIFSAQQEIQSDHDIVHPVIRTGDGYRLGPEIAEWEPDPYRIQHLDISAKIFPTTSKLWVDCNAKMLVGKSPAAQMFRLGLQYSLLSAQADSKPVEILSGSDTDISRPKFGQIIKAGGLVVYWSTNPASQIRLVYDGNVRSAEEDKISNTFAYLTAWWTPSIGRLPHSTTTQVEGPKDWVIVSEGEPVPATMVPSSPDRQVVSFRCDVPITFPKIVGGKYSLAAETSDAGRTFRSYQIEPVEKERGERDVAAIREAVKWYEVNIGKFPFSSYSCFDADTYYGIESYSYTLLRRNITSRFVTHELGHTYFGGLVPCAYTKDTWNESVTQYVDSVVYHNNSDQTLEGALRTMQVPVPLSKMSIPHEFQSATYSRGAYVLKMLENEIGSEAMLSALRDMVATRKGMETTWPIIRTYFEKASVQDLKWFWDQWVTTAEYPTVSVKGFNTVQVEGKPRVFVTLKQDGNRIFKMKVKIILRRHSEVKEQVVTMQGNQEMFRIDSPFEPIETKVEVFGLALANVK